MGGKTLNWNRTNGELGTSANPINITNASTININGPNFASFGDWNATTVNCSTNVNTVITGVITSGSSSCGPYNVTPRTLSIATPAAVTEGNSGTKTITFTVSLSASSSSTVTVNYATSDGTATTADADYAAASGTLTFTAGQTSRTFTVTINGDSKFEADETFTVTLSAPTGASLGTSSATGTITNDDTAPTLSIASASRAEGNSGTSNLTFTITQSAISGLPTTVTYATNGGNATAGATGTCGTTGVDYTTTTNIATIAAGGTTATFNVPICGDTLFEANETFDATLSGATNATIGTATATGTITNDDTAPTLSISSASRAEGNSGTSNLTFTITQSAISGLATTVTYTTSGGNATGGTCGIGSADYTTTTGTASIAAGATTATFSVPVCGDTTYEGDETFNITLSNPVNATLGTASATGTILDDEAPALLASYRFDETVWNGTSGEVKDSSGNNYNATSTGVINNTGTPGPAYGSVTQGTCRFGVFGTGGANTYVALPGTFPGLSGSFSLSVWLNSTQASTGAQRIFVRDDNNNGWALSLADFTNTAILRFFNRSVTFTSPVGGVVSAGGVAIDTSFQLSSNTWYFVALTVDTVGKTAVMYVYDVNGVQRNRMSASFTGTWSSGTGSTSIGAETAASSETNLPFVGRMDEVNIYSGAVTQAVVEALLPITRPCVGVDHIRIEHDGEGSTCAADSVTVKACAVADCSSLFLGGGVTGTLQPFGTAFTIGTSGSATLSVSPSAAGSNTFSVASVSPAPANAAQCRNTVASTNSCSLLVSACPGGANFDCLQSSITPYTTASSRLFTKVSGTAFSVDVAALNAGNTLETGYVTSGASTKTVTVELGTASNAACSGWTPLTPAVSQTLTFSSTDAGRKASASFNVTKAYPNLRCRVTDAVAGRTGCSTDNFAVRPIAPTFTVSPVMATPPSAAATPTVVAGAAFTLTAATTAGDAYAGTLSQNAAVLTAQTTGQDTTQQSGGVVGTLTPATLVANTPATNNATYSEVGYLYLGAGAFADGSYTAVDQPNDCVSSTASNAHLADTADGTGRFGCVIGNKSAVSLGRFIPASLRVAPGTLLNRSQRSCTPASTFTYAGEEMQLKDFTVTARNALATPTTTANYQGVFARLDGTVPANFGFGVVDLADSTLPLTAISFVNGASAGQVGLVSSSGTWASGVGTFTANLRLNRAAAPDGPYASVRVGALPVDSDGVTGLAADNNLDISAPADSVNDRVLLGSTQIRFGRLTMRNAYGSERLTTGLRVPVEAQFWDGSTFMPNTADSCTALVAANVNLVNPQSPVTASNVTVVSAGTLAAGAGSILLSQPSPNTPWANIGSVDVLLNMGAATSSICPPLTTVTPSGTSANLSFLATNGCTTATYTRNPSARASFGVYRSPLIYRRENY